MSWGGSYGSWRFAFKDSGVVQRSCNNSQNLPTTPLVFIQTHLCSLSMIIPTPLPQDAVPSPVWIPLLVFLAVLVLLLVIPMLAAWWLGLRHLMTLGAPQMQPTGMLRRMTDSGCCLVQESEQGRIEQGEGVLEVPKSSDIFSTWGNWIGQHTTNLLHTLSDLSGTLQL